MNEDTKRILFEALRQYKQACEDAIKYDSCSVSVKELPLVEDAIKELEFISGGG